MLNPEIDSFLEEELLVKLCERVSSKNMEKDIKPRHHYTQQQHPTDPTLTIEIDPSASVYCKKVSLQCVTYPELVASAAC